MYLFIEKNKFEFIFFIIFLTKMWIIKIKDILVFKYF